MWVCDGCEVCGCVRGMLVCEGNGQRVWVRQWFGCERGLNSVGVSNVGEVWLGVCDM